MRVSKTSLKHYTDRGHSWFGNCDRTVIDSVFQAIVDAGPDYEQIKCVPPGSYDKFMQCTTAEGVPSFSAWGHSHANPNGSSSVYFCPGVFEEEATDYPLCSNTVPNSADERTRYTSVGVGGRLIHEYSHRMNLPGRGQILDGPLVDNYQDCYSEACVKSSALSTTCENDRIAQAYALYAQKVCPIPLYGPSQKA